MFTIPVDDLYVSSFLTARSAISFTGDEND